METTSWSSTEYIMLAIMILFSVLGIGILVMSIYLGMRKKKRKQDK